MTRLLPIDQNTDVVSLNVEVGGEALPSFVAIRHVEVLRQVNRIPYARLRIADGDAAAAERVLIGRYPFPVTCWEFA